MASNPCLTILLVYSALVTISLIITSALLATNHTSVVCSGEGGDGEVVIEFFLGLTLTGPSHVHIDAIFSFVDECRPNFPQTS